MRNAKGFSLIMIFLLLFQIAHSGGGFMAAAEGGQGIYQDPAKLKVEGKSKDENSITWQVVINEAKQATEELSTIITFNNGQTHRSIDKSVNAKIEQTDQGYEITTPTGQETHTITLTTEITNDEQTNFNLSAKTEFEDETIIAEETVEVVKEETPEKEEAAEEPAKNENLEKDTKTEEKGKEEKSGDEGSQPKAEESLKEDEVEENNNGKIKEDNRSKTFYNGPNPTMMRTMLSVPDYPNPGGVGVDKKATELSPLEWEIELNVQGKDIETSSDIVLVFDRSNSMREGQRERKAKDAAKKFVDELITNASNSNVRIGVVPFGSNTSSNYDTPLPLTKNANALKTHIENIWIDQTGQSQTGGTNIHIALYDAEKMLQNSNADLKTIVLLSDGEPTYSQRAGSYTNVPINFWLNNEYNVLLSNFNYNDRVGNGTSSSTSYRIGSFFSGYRVRDHILPTISEAYKIKENGINIYSIGLEVGSNSAAIYTLQNIHNKGYYQGGSQDMEQIFTEIAASLANAATSAIVTDPLGEMFELVTDGSYNDENYSVTNGSVSWNESTETFTWDIGTVKESETYTLKYKVTIDCTKNPETNKFYPTNGETTLKYKDINGNNAVKNFDVPEVMATVGKVMRLGYRVNAEGEPVDNNGNIVTTPEQAQQLYHDVYVDNLELDVEFDILAKELAGYQLVVGDNPTEIQLSSHVCLTVPFGYAKTGQFIIEKVDADDDKNKLSGATFEVFDLKGNKVETLTTGSDGTVTSSQLPEGTYTLKEITAPVGYEFVEDQEWSVTIDGGASEPEKIKITNKLANGKIKIIKVDKDDNSIRLEGAKFNVKDKDGNVVTTLTTNDNGEAETGDLPTGEYTLEENYAPVGYVVSEKSFTITVDPGKTAEKTITNKKETGKIVIHKVDENGESLKGAEFTLTGEGGFEQVKTSDQDGKIIFDGLDWGTYTLKETKAPEGYRLLAQEKTFEISADNLVFEETIENTKQEWQIPKTGGIGTLGFYGVGLILMGVALWIVLRRRYI